MNGELMDELEDMTDEELTELRDAVRSEQNRRYQVENVPRQVETMIEQALNSGVSRERLEDAVHGALNAADAPDEDADGDDGEHADGDTDSGEDADLDEDEEEVSTDGPPDDTE